MASGTNNTFRQVGIATGIAALGAVFQSRIASSLASSTSLPASLVHPFAQAIASGAGGLSSQNPRFPTVTTQTAHSAFISGLNTIFVVASVVLFVGAILAFVLVRRKDFVASQAPVPAGAG
jgi:hypothetical protein